MSLLKNDIQAILIKKIGSKYEKEIKEETMKEEKKLPSQSPGRELSKSKSI